MPDRVHALLVVRPDGRVPAAAHLRATLDALSRQTRQIDALTIVVCGGTVEVLDIAGTSGAEGVITAGSAVSFAEALRLATARLSGDAVWLLAQDTAPAPDALARLVGALEISQTVAVVAPKVVSADDTALIVSLGETLTHGGRRIGLADDELDQGQHDHVEDVLGADVRGMLVRTSVWRALDGLDDALAGADEGLDLGIRARLAGHRVTVQPRAVVAVAGDGVAGLPSPDTRRRRRHRAFATRTAQLHRRLAYAPAGAVPLHWLTLLPITLWRTVMHLVAKSPALVLPEWGAGLVAAWRPAALARSRSRIRRARVAAWSSLSLLRISRSDLRTRVEADGDPDAAARPTREELRFFAGGGAWVVLAALVVSIAAFPALLAWPTLGGGALAPLSSTLSQLWANALYGAHSVGLDAAIPSDPFSALLALIGTLSPGAPSRALVVLWIAALPLAALGGWFAATRITSRDSLRILAAVLWALAPTFLVALVDGRPAALIAHLALPWLLYAGAVAHRSWASAGTASLVMVVVWAASPSLAPALVALWVLAVISTVVARGGPGVAQVVWTIIPAVVVFLPLAWAQVNAGTPWGLLADPGITVSGGASADAAGRLALVAGFPVDGLGGWEQLVSAHLPGLPTWAPALLLAPLAIVALASLLTPRWFVGAAALILVVLGLGTAFLAVGVSVAFAADGTPVALWPGAALSLAWAGVVGAALVTLDAGLPVRAAAARGVTIAVLVVLGAAAVLPLLASERRGALEITNGPDSTVPAFVDAQTRTTPNVATAVVTPLSSGAISLDVVWNGGATLDGQSTLLATRTSASGASVQFAGLVVDTLSSGADAPLAALASAGVGYILIPTLPGSETDAARATRLAAAAALNQNAQLADVGLTPKGELWAVRAGVVPRADAAASVTATATLVGVGQLAIVVIALLLSLPTAASRRLARQTPRVVGPRAREDDR
ncbi:MAG: glycosyl transferase [Microbacterium sp.]|uniref:Glycosyl transferase n=1 Tax=Microbacterium ginsengisoli TaxID=400772 RepID=A0A0F0LTL7_9MICO|nr:glycosyltransferase [Microbacterium ginsengisoli]KJL35615.1 hypothetical protein RR49_02374 [Microbacterium ginsengisoli]MAL06974.1 glycosyl transferase [Microbacterium sp.]MBN9209108.1 glycosyltransferase [Microbacterium ginsengisoli]